MLLQKEAKTREMLNQSHLLQNRIDTEFTPIGLDMPYRIIAENKLVQIDKYDSTPTLISSSTYSYDGFRRRVKKDVDGTVTFYIYDNEDIRFETDELGNITAEYVHGSGIDEPLAMRRGGTNYYYHVNGLGSITALTDSSKAVVQSYVYDSFGQIILQTGSITNPYTYTAREYDSETGLYYYRARYYDAKMGRFISEDPIGIKGGINLYAYTGNNPINFTDPFGLLTVWPGKCLECDKEALEDCIGTFDDEGACEDCAQTKDFYACRKCEGYMIAISMCYIKHCKIGDCNPPEPC